MTMRMVTLMERSSRGGSDIAGIASARRPSAVGPLGAGCVGWDTTCYFIYTKIRLWLICGTLAGLVRSCNSTTLSRVPRRRVKIRGMPETASAEHPPAGESRLQRSVVLVGLMGAGKTSVGRILAARLGIDFVDADTEIEAAAGESIEEIFASRGEAVFRQGERRVIARLLSGPPRVIASGGGAYMDADTRARIAASGVSVWLKADLDTLVKRISRRGGRPLLKGRRPREVLARLIEERYPVYSEADIRIETGEDPPETVAERIVEALEDHLGLAPLARNDAPPGQRRRAWKSPAGGHRRHRRRSRPGDGKR